MVGFIRGFPAGGGDGCQKVGPQLERVCAKAVLVCVSWPPCLYALTSKLPSLEGFQSHLDVALGDVHSMTWVGFGGLLNIWVVAFQPQLLQDTWHLTNTTETCAGMNI